MTTVKKYLYLLFVAIFATMSVALTSCGDDDEDEPNLDSGNSALTINGKTYYVHETGGATPSLRNYTLSNLNTAQVDLELYGSTDESELYPRCHVNIETEALATPLSKGVKLRLTDNNSTYAEMTVGFMDIDRYTEYKSGSVSIEAASTSSVTLKFDNVKFADDDNQTLTINGTIVCKYSENFD
ncbi:MAG: hypothetical protein NC548_41180 [Lachnospiraceae bacterium]|nr:hypothetical protein [Lachnospiraceae bacterium]